MTGSQSKSVFFLYPTSVGFVRYVESPPGLKRTKIPLYFHMAVKPNPFLGFILSV